MNFSEDLNSFLELEMVVDSGATYTQIPENLPLSTKIERKVKRMLKVATGEIIERDAGIILIDFRNEIIPTLAIFGNEGSEPLLGAVTLEEFGLAVDPVSKILVPVPELMFYFAKIGLFPKLGLNA